MKNYSEYWNEEMEALDADRYHDVQQKAFLKQLAYVWDNSKFYQKKFAEAGVELSDVKGLEDLSTLPFTEKPNCEKVSSKPLLWEPTWPANRKK